MSALLLLATWLYLSCGVVAALRWFPFGERTFFVGVLPPTSPWSARLGTPLAVLCLVALWPLYWRVRAADERRRSREAVENVVEEILEEAEERGEVQGLYGLRDAPPPYPSGRPHA